MAAEQGVAYCQHRANADETVQVADFSNVNYYEVPADSDDESIGENGMFNKY